ncbi:uracil-DNA glycosylase [Vibrio natriegens]|uniref:uracil-DNA glycosylase n=1 Tax=Vibrio natriegens TaxID=691 RepID=UPI003556D55A
MARCDRRRKKLSYFVDTLNFVESERSAGKTIYPPSKDVFNAFRYTEFSDVKVVILGQDPYHGPNQAHGLCFSVLPGVRTPPSLVNIYKELAQDIDGFETPQHGFLQSWAEQGVLLLNTVLTVEQGKAHSHSKTGWEAFTDKVIEAINMHQQGVVFLLWGAHAQKREDLLIVPSIMSLLLLILLHSLPIEAFWGVSTSLKQTNYLQPKVKSRSIGICR